MRLPTGGTYEQQQQQQQQQQYGYNKVYAGVPRNSL